MQQLLTVVDHAIIPSVRHGMRKPSYMTGAYACAVQYWVVVY